MTFPLDSSFLGEFFICPKVAIEHNPQNPYEEITLYIIHCILHLLGYEDTETKKKALMRREEKRLMKLAHQHQCILQPFSTSYS